MQRVHRAVGHVSALFWSCLAVTVVICGCGRVGYAAGGAVDGGGVIDAGADPADSAVVLGEFGEPSVVGVSSADDYDDDPALSGDALELFFGSLRPSGLGSGDIFLATRTSTVSPWGAPVHVLELSSSGSEGYPTPSPDGRTIWLARGSDILVAVRSAPGAPFSGPMLVPELDAGGSNKPGALFAAGTMFVFESDPDGHRDLFVARRGSATAPWGEIAPIVEVNTVANEGRPYVSPDGLFLYFYSDRPGSLGEDIWRASRGTIDEPFGPPSRVAELATAADERDPYLSADQRTIVFSRAGDIYAAVR